MAATEREAPAVNLKVLVEGEEESGSAHLAQLLHERRDQLDADLIVLRHAHLARGPSRGVPESARHDQPPPRGDGSAARRAQRRGLRARTDPAIELDRLPGQLHDEKGRITLPGFYDDDVVEPSPQLRDELAALPFSEADWLQELYRTPDDLPAVEVLARAMREGFRRPVGRMGNAGGGPAQLLFDVAGAPVLFFGTGLPEDHWHDSDERASIDVLLNGAATLAIFWDRLTDV